MKRLIIHPNLKKTCGNIYVSRHPSISSRIITNLNLFSRRIEALLTGNKIHVALHTNIEQVQQKV